MAVPEAVPEAVREPLPDAVPDRLQVQRTAGQFDDAVVGGTGVLRPSRLLVQR